MKPFTIFLIINLLILILLSCGQKKKQTPVNLGGFKPGKYCYVAQFEKDSASLKLNIDKYGKITGNMFIGYHNNDTVAVARQPTNGTITGEFKGDTLIADYMFTSGPKGKSVYTNPLALLHKGDSLTLGQGRIMSYLGRNYLDDKTPIDFQKSKFRFKSVNCK